MSNCQEIKELTKYFYGSLLERFDCRVKLNGYPDKRLPSTLRKARRNYCIVTFMIIARAYLDGFIYKLCLVRL